MSPCSPGTPSFDDDLRFLEQHTEVIVLGAAGTAQVAVAPAWQGRVMTSTTGRPGAPGHGWLHRERIASGGWRPHINVFGGEDRFWLGPEGGNHALFFGPGEPFDLAHWQTPATIDRVPYAVAERAPRTVAFQHDARLTNRTGTTFDLRIDRRIRLLDRPPHAGVDAVAFESENTITNLGDVPWTRQGGLLSIWILGMFKHSDRARVVIPFRTDAEGGGGPIVRDTYFGAVPADRLVVADGVLFFRADGRQRSKIGVGPARARDVLGSYDEACGVLTIVRFTLPDGATDYVDSTWELQDDPYRGDVVNSYNDGPPALGTPPLGPFYELETSSPAAPLRPGESLTHVHRTIHVTGGAAALDPIARRWLGVPLAEVTTALPAEASR